MKVQRSGRNIYQASKTVTFTGAAGLGAQGTVSLFTVTGGLVLIHLIAPRCTVNLASAGGGTLALGTTNQATRFIAATTATDIDASEIWTSNSPTAGSVDTPDALGSVLTLEDIIGTVATANITAGAIEFNVLWEPVTPGAKLVPA